MLIIVDQNKKGKSSERKLTVPKPFKFDTRDKIKAKSIRERKVDEMIEEKRIEEERLISHIFRAKQPHQDIITPKYQEIINKNEARRKEVKENSLKIMKEKEKPFSFYKRDLEKKEKRKNQDPDMNEEFLKGNFKAKNAPDSTYGKTYAERQRIADQEREIRVKRRKELNYAKAKLPPRMEMYKRMKNELEEKPEDKDDLSRFGTFEPSKAKPIPDFDRLQRNFQQALDRK